MKIKKIGIAFVILTALLQPASAQTVADAQKQALTKYPELARVGSPLNAKFVELYRQAKESNSMLLNNPSWPLALADRASNLLEAEMLYSQAKERETKARELKINAKQLIVSPVDPAQAPAIPGLDPGVSPDPAHAPAIPGLDPVGGGAPVADNECETDESKECIEKAIVLYKKSAGLGNALAMTALAECLTRSDPVRYKTEIEHLYTQAAALGNPTALEILKRLKRLESSRLTLNKTWKLRFKQEERAAVEFRDLLSSHGNANVDLEPHPDLIIYQSVTYLMPFKEAVKALNLDDKLSSKTQLGCPGWPASSFDFYGFDGKFDDHYNRLILVVDMVDHVVAVELVDATRKGGDLWGKCRLFTYDFVQYQHRVSTTCYVTQEAKDDYRSKSLRIDSRLYGENSGCDVRLYLPQPIIDLILFNIKQGSPITTSMPRE